jgi:hypothetical protein
LPVVQGGGKIKSLGDWWILIKEHNIIGGWVKITLKRLCRRQSRELYSHSSLLLQRVSNPTPTFTSCRRLNPFYCGNTGVNCVTIFFPVNKKLQIQMSLSASRVTLHSPASLLVFIQLRKWENTLKFVWKFTSKYTKILK